MDEKDMWRPETPSMFGYQPAFQTNGNFQVQGVHPMTFQAGAWPAPIFTNLPPPNMLLPMATQFQQAFASNEPQLAQSYSQPMRPIFNPNPGNPIRMGDRSGASHYRRGHLEPRMITSSSAPRRGRGGYGPSPIPTASHAQV